MKPRVLALGEIHHATTGFDGLSAILELQQLNGGTRDQFIGNCATGVYAGLVAILRTVDSGKFTGPFDAELISKLPSSVKFICHNGAGYDSVNIRACTERGIQVSNTPDVVSEATADIAMTLILGTLRRTWAAESSLRRGDWSSGTSLGRDPKSLMLGILGMGGIGKATALRAASFGFKLQYHNRKPIEELKGILSTTPGVEPKYVSFQELITTSDIVSIHLPLTPKTAGLIGTKEIEAMKQDVIIVNTARGSIIDEDALVKGLESGKIWGVGLDVFEQEPDVHPGLMQNDKAMLLPHIGTATVDTRKAMELVVIDNIKSAITSGKLLTPVPEQRA